MDDLWGKIADLSPKRKEIIADICIKERADAALNAVVIGLKGMNQVHGYGLKRLCKLSVVWGDAISDFYRRGGTCYKDVPDTGMPEAGGLKCDIDREFADLSDRRKREIRTLLLNERKDAQWNAAHIGFDTIQSYLHFGQVRMEALAKQWEYDIRDYYQDRDINEARLKDWIEEVGFIFEDGRLQAYRLKENDKPVRKATVERKMESGDAACQTGT